MIGWLALLTILPEAHAQTVINLAPDASPVFSTPRGIAVDGSGNVFVADSSGVGGSSAIREILAPAYSTVNYIAGSNGNDNPFGSIVGLALDTNGNLFAADQSAAGSRAPTIWEVTKSSNYATAISINATTFQNPNGVALDSSNNLFVSDINLNEVFELTAESTYGVVTQIASLNGNFNAPAGMAVDSSGDVFVADLNNNKVKEILKSGGYTTVNILSDTTLDMPNAIAIWPDGNIVVLNDKAPGVVNEIAAPEYTSVGTIDVSTNDPNYAALDTSGNLFITDTGDNLVKEVLLGVTVSSVSPIGGMTNGMTPVTITGTHFTSPATVNFGTAAATNVTVVSPTEITANSPAASAGVVDVTVTTGVGTSFTSPSDHFSFGPTATTSIPLKNLTQTQAASFLPVNGAGGVAPLSYSISPPLPTGLTISPSSGDISGTPLVTLSMTTFTVAVTDSLSNSAQASFNLMVNSAVTATQTSSLVSLTENHEANVTPVTGGGGTPPIVYTISPQLPADLQFGSSGVISGNPSVTLSSKSFTVKVTDSNGATASNSFILIVNPSVTATRAIGSKTLTQNLAATGFTPVTGGGGTGTLSYSISPLLPAGLSLDTSTGVVSGTPTATLAASPFTIRVTDSNGATASNSFTLTVNSAVTAFGSIASAALTLNHAAPGFTPVTGGGGTAPLSFSISPMLPAGLSFSMSTGVVSGTPTATLAASPFTITVTDSNGAAASNTFTLAVNPAVTATRAIGSKTLTQDHAAPGFTPVTGGGGTAPLSFSISPMLPAGLSFSMSTGIVSGTPTATLAASPFTIMVTDSNGATASNTFTLIVNPAVTATRAIGSKTLTQDLAAPGFTPVTGGGGTAPLSFSISPMLPAGLSFSMSTGVVSGTPTATLAATPFTITVADSNGATASNTFTLTVNPAVTATRAIGSETLTQNHAAPGSTPVTGGGGTAPLSFSISPMLPAGLSFSMSTGVVSGTPTATLAATPFTITVADSNGATASNSFTLTVNSAVTAFGSIASATLTLNHAVTGFTPVTGGSGTGTLSYSISPLLPAGLSFNTSTGEVSGTPTATLAATPFTITVTDSNGATASNTFTLTVNPAVTATRAIGSETLTQNHAATGFTPVTGSGGTAPLSFSISPMLPAGLSLSRMTGAITGTTAATSPAVSYTVTVTDAIGATGANTFSLSVNGAVTASPSIASEVLTKNQPAASFMPVTGGGGTGTLSYSILPLLPSGLSLDTSTGVVSGTPTATSAVTGYVVTVTDANGAAATAGFELMVSSAVTASQAVSAAFLTRGFAISPFTPVTGGGGTAPLLFNIFPALPSGLSFNTRSGAISGTPAVESSATNYMITVTDTNGASASAGFSLTVNGPVTATQVVAFLGLTIDRATTPVRPVTGSGGTGTIHYSISPALPPGIALGSTTGQISGLPTITSASATYTVTVTDANGEAASANFSLAVNPPVTATPAVASKVLTENQLPTSFTPVTGGGGTTPVSFSIAPALPAGLTFSTTTGAITGSPTATHGASSFSVTVTDANGDTASNSFSLTVNPAVTATQSIASEVLTENHAVTSFTPVMGGGGTAPLGFGISPALPAGLTFSTISGVVSGTPTSASAATSYIVTVTDANGATANSAFSLTVNPALTATLAIASEALTFNAPADFIAVTGAGGTGTLNYSISPVLPAGLTIHSATGAITGTPTATTAAASYIVTVTDADGATATAGFSLTVNKATPTLSWAAPASIVYGTALSAIELDATASVPGNFTYTPQEGTELAAGSHTLSVSFTPSNTTDYTAPPASTAKISVIAAPLTVAVNNATKSYGTANPALTGVATGFENGDTADSVGLAYSTTATTSSAIGVYPISASITSPNYTLNVTPGTLTVAGATLLVMANNATKVYGTANPAFTGKVTGQQNGDTFTESFTTSATISSKVGTYPILPIVLGSNLADYAQSVTDGTLTVTQAASVTSVQVSNTMITPGQSVTLSATVASTTTGTPTGTVSFYDNGELLNTSPAVFSGGVATYAAGTLAPGLTHSITAAYSGDMNFTPSTSTASASTTIAVAALDFTFMVTGPATLTVAPGQSANYQFQVAPDSGSYAGTVNFAGTGLPPGATITFSPASIIANSGPETVTATIQTAAAAGMLDRDPPASAHRKLAPFAFSFLVLFGAGTLRKRGRLLYQLLCVFLLLGAGAVAMTLSGCGGRSGFFAQAPQNYAVTITATAGSLQHSTTVTLNVQ